MLLRNPAFLAVALASAMIQSSHALYYGFSTVQWRAAGFDGTLIGALWSVGVVRRGSRCSPGPGGCR